MSSAHDAAEELYEHRHDPDEWAEEPEAIEVRPTRSSVLSVRLPRAELDALEAAAAERGETLSQYVRMALAMRLHAQAPDAGNAAVMSASGVVGSAVEFTEKRVWSSSAGSVTGAQGDKDGTDAA